MLREINNISSSLEFIPFEFFRSVHRVELGVETGHALLTELLERGQRDTGVVESIVIISVRKQNCRLGRRRPAGFAVAVFTDTKDDRVGSIYAETRCETASTRRKHSNIEKFPLEKETVTKLAMPTLWNVSSLRVTEH